MTSAGSNFERRTPLLACPLINIVDELLDLARIEARRGSDFVLESVDLADLVHSVLYDFDPPRERTVPQLQAPATATTVNVDLNKMRQALSNVLSNAYKYSPGGGEVHVRLVSGPPVAAGTVPTAGVEVRDHGIGMTTEQLGRVSERFYRADASGNIPGTGLGMSIVKEITELLGGRLALASVPCEGTAVTFWLPVAAASLRASADESAFPTADASPITGDRMNRTPSSKEPDTAGVTDGVGPFGTSTIQAASALALRIGLCTTGVPAVGASIWRAEVLRIS